MEGIEDEEEISMIDQNRFGMGIIDTSRFSSLGGNKRYSPPLSPIQSRPSSSESFPISSRFGGGGGNIYRSPLSVANTFGGGTESSQVEIDIREECEELGIRMIKDPNLRLPELIQTEGR